MSGSRYRRLKRYTHLQVALCRLEAVRVIGVAKRVFHMSLATDVYPRLELVASLRDLAEQALLSGTNVSHHPCSATTGGLDGAPATVFAGRTRIAGD